MKFPRHSDIYGSIALWFALIVIACWSLTGCANLSRQDVDKALGVAHKATRAVCAADGVIERIIDARSGGRPLSFAIGAEPGTETSTVTRGAVRIVIRIEPAE